MLGEAATTPSYRSAHSEHFACSEHFVRVSPTVCYSGKKLIGNDGGGVDFHQPLGAGEGRNHDAGRNRIHALEPAADDAVHRLAVARIDEVDADLADVVEVPARFFHQQVDIGHGLLGLPCDVSDTHALGGVQILPDLPT